MTANLIERPKVVARAEWAIRPHRIIAQKKNS